jgi:hypothetical protein
VPECAPLHDQAPCHQQGDGRGNARQLPKYYNEIVSTSEEIKTQVAHDTFGFTVSSIGGHERRDGRWRLLPLWKGFESQESECVWQDLDDVFAGIPVLAKRLLRRLLLKSKTPKKIQDGTDMCGQLELEPEDVATEQS